MSDAFWTGALPAARALEWSSEKELYIEMRDGVRLSTDVHIPKDLDGPFPTVLVRTPYDKDVGEGIVRIRWVDYFLRQGYAVVVQNERGHFFSEGSFDDYLEGAGTDGFDTVEWIVRQGWSNGKVGTIGCSSSAEHQWPMAAANHPAHAAMIPGASGTAVGDVDGNETRGAFYRGGIPMLSLWMMWYGRLAVTERPVLPRSSTQEERLRLRNFFSMSMRRGFAPDTAEKLKHLPSQDVLRQSGGPRAPFDKYITWTPADERWRDVEHIGAGDRPRVPALHVNTWHDVGVGEMTRLFKYLQELETPDQYLIIGPGPHCLIWQDPPYVMTKADAKELMGGLSAIEIQNMPAPDLARLRFGDLEAGDARYRGVDHGYPKLFLAWFERWLKGADNDTSRMPRVQLYVMNRGWVLGERWPLRGVTPTDYYLVPDPSARLRNEAGMLSSEVPVGESADTYVYNPLDPTPSLGGGCCSFAAAIDQRPVSARRDVLVYSTPPLEEAVSVVGPVEVKLFVSSSARDTDFIVRLVDVYPDGKAINLADDGFRMRYRDGFDRKSLMEDGEIYEISLTNMVTGNRFLPGHRIRIEISSSSFPNYERNLNTGGNNFDETDPVVAENTIHHGLLHPARITLPILPE
ncbi:CocE/NonD family hydrolase [Sphaerisporangium sp. NPDC051011]|uniref:CocE/NonD family hydrolase n=1 Tax=Sphaerisporangium sp. NPDC051011 TaxID=3155792 RepID=UPI0033C8E20E